ERACGSLMIVVVVALLLEIAYDHLGLLVSPFRKQHDVVAIVLDRILATGLDDDRAVVSHLLLKSAVAVIPVGSALMNQEAVHEGLVRHDPRKAEAGDAVHRGGHSNSMPMNRGMLLEVIGDRDGHGVALAPMQDRTWDRAVDCGCNRWMPGKIDGRFFDSQIEVTAVQICRSG